MTTMDKIMGIGSHYDILRRIAKKCPNRSFTICQFMPYENRKDGIYDVTNFKDTSAEWEMPSKPSSELFIATSWHEACDILEA